MADDIALRQYITCDGEDCDEIGPSKRCSRCKTEYYCSAHCQKSHWRTHRPDCRPVGDMREQCELTGELKGAFPAMDAERNDNGEGCSICFEPEMKKPFQVEGCGHCFCFECLSNYQRISSSHECPLCRGQVQSMSSRIELMASRVYRSDVQESERIALAREGLEELNLYVGEDERREFGMLFAKVEFMGALGDVQGAVEYLTSLKPKITALNQHGKEINRRMNHIDQISHDPGRADEVERLLDEAEVLLQSDVGYVKDGDLIETLLKIAQMQQHLCAWKDSRMTYRELCKLFPEQHMLTPPYLRQIYAGMTRCLYEEGNYEDALYSGSAAIEMNRFFPGCHKYVCLAYQKLGRTDDALKSAAHGVLYEAPWDDLNKASCWDMWNELQEGAGNLDGKESAAQTTGA